MATAIEIPKNKWAAHFTALGQYYQGWHVTAEVLDQEFGNQHAINGLPLQGLSYETKGSQAGDILVEAGDLGSLFATHLVHRPRVVRVAATQPGAEADVEIEDEDGIITIVHLHSLQSPHRFNPQRTRHKRKWQQSNHLAATQ